MRIFSKIALGAVLLLVVGAMIQPTWGSCTTARTIGSSGAYLVSNPTWGGAGGTRACTNVYGCYQTDVDGGAQRAPISANFSGSFWAFPGYGVPGAGGIDNGTWDASNWTKQVSLSGPNPYYYPAFLTTQVGTNGSPGNNPSWASSALVDGCITDSFNPGEIDAEECTCVLLTDEWDGVGYFAVYSSFTSGIGDFDITPTTMDADGRPTIRLSAIPKPGIVFQGGTNGVTALSVDAGTLDPLSIRTDGACDCGVAFKVYSWRQVHDPSDPCTGGTGGDSCDQPPVPPASRDTFCSTPGQLNCWGEALAPGGGTQPPTPFNGGKAQTNVQVDCNASVQEDLFLATRLVADPASGGGFDAGNVSQNSFWVACGDVANIAEPNRPDRDKPRGRSDQAPRGRDNNRGRGQR